MLEIKGNPDEIKRIKECMWMSTACPFYDGSKSSGCDKDQSHFQLGRDCDIEAFYGCIGKNISFVEVPK